MRIAFIVEKFPAISETFILNQVVGLVSRGHHVDIYANSLGDKLKVDPRINTYELLQHTYIQTEVPHNYLWRTLNACKLIGMNFHKNPVLILKALNIFKYGKYALSLRLLYLVLTYINCDRSRYDIIHCQFGMLGLQGILLRDMGAIQGKIITSLRGFDISWYIQEFGEDVYKELFVKGDFFLANCDFFRQKAIAIGCSPAKIAIHRSGIDSSLFQYRLHQWEEKQPLKIATVGRLIEKKGIEYAIKAISILTEKYPDIEYSIIGDGWLKDELQQLIISLQLTEKVKLLGWKSQLEIIEILQSTHIFIASSVTAADGNQDAPVNTLKEAMSMGLPVIATDHGGIPELVQDGVGGLLVPERDANAIAFQVQYLVENPQVWEGMGKTARKYVQTHYDTNQLNDELVRIYQRIAWEKRENLV